MPSLLPEDEVLAIAKQVKESVKEAKMEVMKIMDAYIPPGGGVFLIQPLGISTRQYCYITPVDGGYWLENETQKVFIDTLSLPVVLEYAGSDADENWLKEGKLPIIRQ